MPRKKRFDYKAIARQLRGYGFKIRYGTHTKGAGTSQSKAAVRRAWNKVRMMTPGGNEKQEFIFRKATKQQKKAVKDSLSSKQITPGGFFIKVPQNVKPSQFKFRVDKDGTIRIHGRGARGGVREEIIKQLDPEEIADNPKAAVRKAIGKRRPKYIRIMVNGFEGQNVFDDLESFMVYMPEFLAQLQDPNRPAHRVYKGKGPGGRLAHTRTRGNGSDEGLEPEEIADIFHLKLIYQKPSHAAGKSKRQKRHKRR